MITDDQVADRIKTRSCEKCGEPLDDGKDYILTFFRGSFIVLHEECGDFIDTAKKGPRITNVSQS